MVLAMITIQLNAQEVNSDRRSQLGLSIGYAQGYFKDLNFSPLNYRQGGITYALNYTRTNKNKNSLFKAQFDYTSGKLTTKASEFFTVDRPYLGNLTLEYFRKLSISNSQLSIYLGGQYKTNISFVIFDDLYAFTFLFAHNLGATALAEYQLNDKSKIIAGLSLPLLTHLVRPPLTGHDKELTENSEKGIKILYANGDLTSLNKYQAIDFNLGYEYQLSDRWNLNLQYRMQYHRTTSVHLLKHLQNHISVGASIKF